MATPSSSVVLERIDHGVLPSNDLGRAFRFWSGFMGGQIGHLTNLTMRGLNREVPMIVFMTVANHRGFGLALQDFRISPKPARPMEGVVWGFEVAADNLAAAAQEAEKQKLNRAARHRLSALRARSKNRSRCSTRTATRWNYAS